MAEKIVGEYDIKVDKAIKNLDKLQKEVGDIDKSATKSAKKTEDAYSGMASKLSSQFKSLAGTIGLAFGTQQLVSFGQESVRVAAQAEGISRAFERLNRPDLLNNLRKATRGTVSDLKLMQQAVRANNFQVPLEKLGSFFEFATKRSIETGESVDYLVQSIVDGIGRKSTLVLDNLGISASELQDEIKRTGDFGEAAANIIERSLAQTGDVADTTAIRIAQLNTALENTKVLIGEGLIEASELYIEAITPVADEAERAATGIYSLAENTGYLNSVMNVGQKALEFSAKKYIDIKDSIILALQAVNGLGHEMSEAAYRLTLNNEELVEFNKLSEVAKDITVRRWMAQEDFNDLSEDAIRASQMYNEQLLQENENVEEVIKNLAYYNKLIKDLQAEQKDANTTRERVRELEDEINEAMRQRLLLLGRLREVGGTTLDPIDPIDNIEALQVDEVTDDIMKAYEHRNGEVERLVKERNKIEARLAEERRQQEIQSNLEMAMVAMEAVSSITSSIARIQQNAFAAEQQELEQQLEQGLITREEYEAKLNKIKQKEAQASKDAAIFQAVISTAAAVVNALGSYPFTPANIATAAAVGVAGAAQIAAIASQPLPQFAEGGFVDQHGEIKGRKHSQGGVIIEAEGNEFITAAKYAQPNAEILKAINSGQWEKYKVENIIAPAIEQVLDGGFDNIGASMMLQTNWTDKNLLKQGDRNRASMRDGFMYLGNKIESLKGKQSRWN